jgi:hypothetical protein
METVAMQQELQSLQYPMNIHDVTRSGLKNTKVPLYLSKAR